MITWFTADLHLGHRNLLHKYQKNRTALWDTVEEMDEALIAEWRDKIGPKDTVYFLGDLTLDVDVPRVEGWLQQLTGHIKIAAGNHDRWIKKLEKLPQHVEVIAQNKTMKRVSVDGKTMIVSHYPIEDWPGRQGRPGRGGDWRTGRWHLHGHSHGTGPYIPGRLDIGWDTFSKILSWDEIRSIIESHG